MPNLITHIHPMGTKEAKSRDLALNRIMDSIDAFGGQNAIFRQLNRFYHSISPTRTRTTRNDVAISLSKDREDVFVPMSFALVESAVPHLMFNLFGQKPHQKFLGRTAEDHEKADAVTKMIDYHMEQATVFLSAIPIAKSIYKYGTGIGKVGYRYESRIHKTQKTVPEITGFDPISQKLIWGEKTITEGEPIIEFDGATLDPVSVFLWHPDPLYWELDRMRYVGETRWTDRWTLDKINEQYMRLTSKSGKSGKPMYKHLDKIPLMTRGKIGTTLQMDSSDDTAEAMGWNNSPAWRSRWRNMQEAEEHIDDVVLIREYWEDDRLIEVANDEIVIRDGPNPFEDKKKPYVVSTCHPIEFSVWGKGYLHVSRGTQEHLNSWRTLNLRQGRFNVHNIWGVPEGVDMDIDSIEPQGVYQIPFTAEGKPLLVPLMQGRPLPPESLYIEQTLQMDAFRALSAPDFTAGGIGQGSNTATEAKLQGQSSASRLRLQGAISELSFLVPVAKKFLSRIHQFGKEEMVFRITGTDGAVEFLQLTRQEIAGAYDVEPAGSIWYPNLDVLRQQLLQALSIVRGDPVMLEITDIYEIWKELWKMFPGIRSPERFLRPPAEKTWDPEKENIILDAGQYVQVTANEQHQQHQETHDKGMRLAAGQGNSLEAYSQHMADHGKFTQQQGAGAQGGAPQEQPGLKGYAGNVPRQDQATETETGIQSRIDGGVGV